MSLYEHASLETADGEPVALLGARITGELRGLLLKAGLQQRFANPGDAHIELVYRFPLPWGAVLLGVEVELAGKRLAGAVVERAQAGTRYEEALADGDAAIMLERSPDGSYCLNLGNLAPREHCTITLRYAQTLQFEQGALRLLIPTTIAPHYEGGPHSAGLPAHQRMAPSAAAQHALELELAVHGSLARARVASPSHPISVAHAGQGGDVTLHVALARQGWLDRDFVLVLDQLAQAGVAVAGPDFAQSGRAAVLASFCPRLAGCTPQDVAVKLLVDCSGSMGGDSIDAARRALQAIVLQLRGDDRFCLSRFGSRVEHRTRALWKLTDATRIAAQRWVGALEADLGGTEMQQALASTLALAHDRRSDLLLVTDGQVGSIDAVIQAAQGSGHRVFVVGIGASVAQGHLRRLAQATGGACDFVAPGEAVEPAVLRMFARLRSPRLVDVRLQWPGAAAPEWQTALPPALFDGDTVNVFAGLAAVPQGEASLWGRSADAGGAGPELELGRATLDGRMAAPGALSRMAAAARIAEMAGSDATAAAASAGVRLAVDYQLVTDGTNFLLVHERTAAQRATQMPALHQERPMLAAGWGGAGSVRFSRVDSAVQAGAAMCVPAVWRTNRSPGAGARAGAGVGTGMDLDIPAFLRSAWSDEEVSEPPRPPARRRVSRKNPKFWARSEFHPGWTPLGLAEWLRINPEPEWPATYAGLQQIGLGLDVVEWVELVLAPQAWPGAAEQDVVRHFLAWMNGADMRAALSANPPDGSGSGSGSGSGWGRLPAPAGAAAAGMAAAEWFGFADL